MDRNSAISGGTDASDGYYDVDYTWAKATAGRNTVRKATMVMPEGSTLTYEYLSTSSLHDADASRVTRVKVSTTAVASYAYNGVGQLVGTSLPQPDVFMTLYDPADLADYDRLDNFSRVTQSKWTRDLATDKDFYHTTVTWDRNGNVTLIEDQIHSGLDVAYTNDNVNRLTKAEEGTWNGSSITSRTREQNWTLDQVGNWEIAKLDLDGDNNWNESGEYNDDRTHDVVNQLTARDTDDNGTDNYTLTYDNVGNLTDDGEAYEYVYDVWGRLRKVLNTSTQALIEEFWYNGLGYRITFHADATGNGTTDGSDPKYHLIYDERWRHVATYRADDDNPKEAFVSHQAGLDGTGSSSYIDSVILRQRDANSGWTSAADGTMEERSNFCQNWRSDVSAILTSAGVMVEWGKFTAYGLPIGLPAGDIDSDFITDTGDVDAIKTWVAAYDVRADLDLDGDIDATDGTLAEGYEGWQLGWNELSHSTVANRIGYAGYHKDVNLDISHVRNRVLEPHLGRWTSRHLKATRNPSISLYNNTYATSALSSSIHRPMSPGHMAYIVCRFVNGTGGIASHCYIVCCTDPDDETTCNSYSLLNTPANATPHMRLSPFNLACIVKNDPADPISERQYAWRDIPGLDCACFERAFQRNSGCRFRYRPINCNSNWFAISLLRCCSGRDHEFTGRTPGQTPGAYQLCCRNDEYERFCGRRERCPFRCPEGSPGDDFDYCCPCEQ